MALVYPFQGFRYSKEAVGDLNKVVTQPYDKTTPAMQDEYYERSPYNVVRITLSREQDPSYPEAGTTFRKWIRKKVLVRDSSPSIYAYYQEYRIENETRTQRGFISLLDLKNAEAGVIPHEHTLAAPKQDRLNLMRSLEANEDFIYMLYSDETLAINTVIDKAISGREPDIEVIDEYGAIHRVWAISQPDVIDAVRNGMQQQRLFIADGHHRFETSVNFMNECERKGWRPGGIESFDKRMITCFNSADGVTILPTHRLVRDLPGFEPRFFLRSIEQYFEVEPASSPESLWERMKEERQSHVFGFYAANLQGYFFLRLREEATSDPLILSHTEPYRKLDVSILHTLLLERFLGIDADKLAAQSHIDYVRERETAIRLVDESKCQAAFFLNPTTAEQMQLVASLGERMPQKSTDFFPKLLTGLVFMQMRIRK
ncbi:MAG: DUF1015 domain-containing protein [Acidobacteria bacterium]|nr:DUF1015 domain-containing protein [Acidobacteriota bacterium]